MSRKATWPVVLGLLLLFPLPPLAAAEQRPQKIPALRVGHAAIKGTRLRAHEGRWLSKLKQGDQWVEQAVITEKTEISKQGRKSTLRRTQKNKSRQGFTVTSTGTLDRKTLACLESSQKIGDLPPGASLPPGTPVETRWTYDGKRFDREQTVSGKGSSTEQGELSSPMFDMNFLGLVVAALPLKPSYTAKLPVVMHSGGAVTEYWVIARVTEKVDYEVADGETVSAWIVETDWADFETEVISAPGGANRSGGAYTILAERHRTLPHVLRYVNETFDIALEVKAPQE